MESPHPAMLGGRGQGVGLRETDLLGEARAGCLGRGRSRRQGVKDFGGARDQSVLLSPVPPPAQKTPLLSAPLLPSRRDGERRGEGSREGRAASIHLESSLLGEGEWWGKCLTLWCQSRRGALPVVGCIEA